MTERAKSWHEPASPKESIVFVIDDDVAMRTTLSSLFRSVGLRVELFGSAKANDGDAPFPRPRVLQRQA